MQLQRYTIVDGDSRPPTQSARGGAGFACPSENLPLKHKCFNGRLVLKDVKRSDLSDVSYPYEPAENDLDSADKAMYNQMLENAKSFTPFAYTAEEHGYDEMDRALRVYYTLGRDYPEVENYFFILISD